MNRRRYFILTFLFTFQVFANTNFSGSLGVKGDIQSNPEKSNVSPTLNTQSFFLGQFDFSPSIIFRTNVLLETQDLLENGIYESTESKLKIEELSLTMQFFLGNFLNYFSLFTGSYESLGSDSFLRRYFGIEKIDSRLTESWTGAEKSTILPFHGIGGAYTIRPNIAPIAIGTLVYINHPHTSKNEINTDLRFACAFDNFCFDMAGGMGVPLESERTTTTDGDIFLVVDALYFHGGFEMLIGNNHSTSIFSSVGIQDSKLTEANENKFDISAKDLYFLVEPRFVFSKFKTNLTVFSFPENTVESLFLIDKPLGVNLCILKDNLHVKNASLEIGTHLTYSIADKTIADVEQIRNDGFSNIDTFFKISPFINIKTKSSYIQTIAQVVTSELKNSWKNSVKFSVSYKNYF